MPAAEQSGKRGGEICLPGALWGTLNQVKSDAYPAHMPAVEQSGESHLNHTLTRIYVGMRRGVENGKVSKREGSSKEFQTSVLGTTSQLRSNRFGPFSKMECSESRRKPYFRGKVFMAAILTTFYVVIVKQPPSFSYSNVFAHHELGVTHVLVTRGAGYIGSHAVLRLLKDSYRVTIVDNLSRGNMGAIKALQEQFEEPDELQFIIADLGNAKSVRKIFSKNAFDGVIHFATVAYVGESMLEPLRSEEGGGDLLRDSTTTGLTRQKTSASKKGGDGYSISTPNVDGEEMIDLSAGIRRNIPLVEITLGLGVDSPISEMEAVVTPLPTVSSTEEDNNQKSITIEELPSQPEIGSSSSTPVVSKASKNKMKNYLRRVRKKVVKARKSAEAKALKHVKSEANQKFVAPSTNPFPGGNHFHPSPVTQRREVVETRARSSIHLLDYYMARINQARTEQTPAPGPRPSVEGYDPSTLLDDVRSRFYTSQLRSNRFGPFSKMECSESRRKPYFRGKVFMAAILTTFCVVIVKQPPSFSYSNVFAHHELGVTHVLVTRGAGYIGSHAVLRLLKDSYRVTIVDNLSRGNMGAIKALQEQFEEPDELQFIIADLGNAKSVRKIFSKNAFDGVMHFATVAYIGESMLEPLRSEEGGGIYSGILPPLASHGRRLQLAKKVEMATAFQLQTVKFCLIS
ncbi:hypothetical protein IEQ34_015290 [Dendrobium chrysotoxum]|uniref:NAD(P)-binding domain-containing protein n=1 Tax=Dendrobium chrysotoxum TaxID=161865 RepID=A0AAV7GHZ0_DENCH|nr:hypothetical protein IEQ34_015290 [Dendrobium chrysotoxum]